MNKHSPVFQEKIVEVDFEPNPSDYVAAVVAYDIDAEQCRQNGNLGDCPCGTVLYAIESGNEDSFFMVEPTTGVIKLSSTDTLPSSKVVHELIVSARNSVPQSKHGTEPNQTAKDGKDACLVRISSSDISEPKIVKEENKPHSRRKRSVSRWLTQQFYHDQAMVKKRGRPAEERGIESSLCLVTDSLKPQVVSLKRSSL